MARCGSSCLETRLASYPSIVKILLKPAAHIAIVLTAGLLTYANTFHVPFTFDDQRCIITNPAIRSFEYYSNPALAQSVSSSLQCSFATRVVGHFTFALNFWLGGLDVVGYHVLNLAVHLANALLVYLLVRLTFRTPLLASRVATSTGAPQGASSLIALFSALLFACHPVQTQAVTYVTQRFTSLATFFFLATIILYAGHRLSAPGPKRWILFASALATSLLAMRTKEISFTLPVVLALFELQFLQGSGRARLLSLAPFFLTLLVIPVMLFGAPGAVSDVGEIDTSLKAMASNVPITRWEYVLTQFRVLVTYWRLFLLPIGQNVDYDYPVHRSLLEASVLLSALLLLAVFAMGVFFHVRSGARGDNARRQLRLASFGIFWFFATIAVESSFVPLADVIFEHRMYLPSVGVFIAAVTLAFFIREKLEPRAPFAARLAVPLLSAAVLAYGLAAHARNDVWRDEVRLWEDAARKSPANVRPRMQLAALHVRSGRLEEAAREVLTAIRLSPDYADAYNTLGVIKKRQGLLDEAMAHYLTALQLRPGYAEVHANIGLLFGAKGRVADATRALQEAVRLKPDFAEAHNALGVLYAQQGNIPGAIGEFETALRLNPGHLGARSNLERAMQLGRVR